MNPIAIRFTTHRSGLWLATALTLLTACSQSEHAAPPAADPAPAVAALDAPLQAVYDRSCTNCHSVPASGAPQRGDIKAWTPRLAKGLDVLIDHTINGFQAMPPMGACMDCNEEQYRALILYMAQNRSE
ncbi:c-type cytochrome [Lysobacter sp. CA199]|uniref:c-type cytochrome n=1 Tax=Lysobacter sp. CA199 TaxID=3455608 RepID=UPI003F8D252D